MADTEYIAPPSSPAEKVLREPFGMEIPEYLERIRRNLLVFGFVAVAYKLSGAVIQPESSILGLKFDEINPIALETGLGALVFYHLAHFLWISWEQFDQWRVRQTGFSELHPINKGTAFDLPPNEQKEEVAHRTLYDWWLFEAEHARERIQWSESAKQRLDEVNKICDELNKYDRESRLPKIETKIHELQNALASYGEQASPVLMNREILDARIKRFDKCFWRQQKNWYIRWVALEFGLPSIAGFVGVSLIAWDLAPEFVKVICAFL